jgi:Tfp pilus assembly protein PilN
MQQINLLNPDLRPRRQRLTLSLVAAGLALAALGLAVAAGLTSRETARVQQQVQDGEALLHTLQARLDQLSAQAKRTPDPRLVDELNRTQERLDATQAVMAALDAGVAGDSTGFSATLAGLARQALPGVWLTGVVTVGPSLNIRGRLLNADLMPEYLRRLKAEDAFQGRRFGDFTLSDHPAPAKSGDGAGSEKAEVEPGPLRYVEFELKALTTPASGGGTASGSGARP